jgi:splicing factor 3B subunit 5
MAADRFSFNKSFEHVQNKFVGTGHSDITKFEWASNQHRDTMASHIGHSDMLSYFAVAQNDSIGRVRYQLLEVRDSFFVAVKPVQRSDRLLYFCCRKCSSRVVHRP